VLSPGGEPVTAKLTLDGKSLPPLQIITDKMYTLVDQPGRTGGVLKVEFDAPIEAFAFTFG
jgi:hypothetical protein